MSHRNAMNPWLVMTHEGLGGRKPHMVNDATFLAFGRSAKSGHVASVHCPRRVTCLRNLYRHELDDGIRHQNEATILLRDSLCQDPEKSLKHQICFQVMMALSVGFNICWIMLIYSAHMYPMMLTCCITSSLAAMLTLGLKYEASILNSEPMAPCSRQEWRLEKALDMQISTGPYRRLKLRISNVVWWLAPLNRWYHKV